MSRRKIAPLSALCERIGWNDIDPQWVRRLIRMARSEDLAGAGLAAKPAHTGDVTTRAVVRRGSGRAELRARRPLTLCGLPLLPLILEVYRVPDATFKPAARDGDRLPAGALIGTFSGPAAGLLTAERVLLNFLQHLSGIATQTSAYVDALGDTRTRLLDTRKTTPGFRVLEKYAVACGGAWNHRIGLFDRVLIKDNHLAAAGASRGERLASAIREARRRSPGLRIEVEVDHLEQIPPVIEAGADIVMLDNFTVPQLRRAVALCRGRIRTEASGGVTRKFLPKLAGLGLDFISTGALVHQSSWVDIGLDWL
ncbi:MAG: carboxylating nicotinate-nucleotide diphosphorylase [Verrucomicrobia bacterium]|nr:MAG: carboxylating nicotinate-nucleotide diphosphorylase [Verrucomicrobiota bacterium]